MGIALSLASGSLQFLENGAWTKRFQVGNSAGAGLHAAYLAGTGYVGAGRPLEGSSGFFQAYAPSCEYTLDCCDMAYDGVNIGKFCSQCYRSRSLLRTLSSIGDKLFVIKSVKSCISEFNLQFVQSIFLGAPELFLSLTHVADMKVD